MEGTNDTCNYGSEFCPSCWDGKEAHHITNDPSFEVKDLFG